MKVPTFNQVEKKLMKLDINRPDRRGKHMSYFLNPLDKFIYHFSPTFEVMTEHDRRKLRQFNKDLQALVDYIEKNHA